MAKFQLVGSSYVYRSVAFDCQRSVNLYPVVSETGTSKNISGMQGTPGLLAFSQPDVPIYKEFAGPTRGSHTTLGRCFFVVDRTLYEITSDGTATSRGSLITLTGFVGMADNGAQIMLVDGLNGYIFTLADNTFVQITDADFPGADTVCFCNGYFIVNKPSSGEYFISGINDGLTWDALDFASAEGSPDDLVAVAALHQQVWLLGSDTVEVVFNSGGADFPFAPIQGVFIEYGCAAKASIAISANTMSWLGADADGKGIVWMTTGYQPQRISTFAVEFAIQGYADISTATGYTYQEDGHYFYVLNFDEGTWVYDITTSQMMGSPQWHERLYYNLDTGEYERHRGQCHAFCFNKHLIGDYETGVIYEQSLDIYDDNGNPKRWMRTFPYIADDLEYIYFNKLQVDMQTGAGLITGADEDVDPEVMLQWSDDNGHSWSNERWASVGAIGEYAQRVIWRRLGRARTRAFRLAGSTATKVFLIAGHIDATPGSN